MSPENIIRAWKDEDFRNSLSEEERKFMPENPAGLVELKDTELSAAAGGAPLSRGNCPETTDCTNLQGCTNKWMCFEW